MPYPNPLPSPVLAAAQRARRRHRVPGAVIGLWRQGAVSAGAIGVADLRSGQPMSLDHRFRLCSLTKLYTATLAMRVVERGLIDLDASLDRVLRLVDPRGLALLESVTLRHVLSHSAGIEPELPGDLGRFGEDDDALARAMREYRSLERRSTPGARWDYCNTGYWLAGHVCATVLEMSFEDALRDEVLRPVGSRRTSWVWSPRTAAQPHRTSAGRVAYSEAGRTFPRVRRPSGGLVGDAPDVVRFARSMLKPDRLLGAPAWHEMTRTHIASAEGFGQALGWQVHQTSGGSTLEHDGSYFGYQTRLVLVPAADVALVVLTNSDRGRHLGDAVVQSVLTAGDGQQTLAEAEDW